MNYGTGAAPSLAGATILPFTSGDILLLAIATTLIGLGVAIMAISFVMTRKNTQLRK